MEPKILDDMDAYLGKSEFIDFDDIDICKTADELFSNSSDELDFIEKCYEYVKNDRT